MQRSEALAPAGPSRTAAHMSGGKVSMSSHGSRASSGPVSNAMRPTPSTDPMITAVSSTRRAERSLNQSGPSCEARRIAGVTIRMAVAFESMTRTNAIGGLYAVSTPAAVKTNAAATHANASGTTKESPVNTRTSRRLSKRSGSPTNRRTASAAAAMNTKFSAVCHAMRHGGMDVPIAATGATAETTNTTHHDRRGMRRSAASRRAFGVQTTPI